MQEITVTEARAQLSDLVSQVAFGGQSVVLTRHGKPLVALVPAATVLGESALEAPDGPVVIDVTSRHDETAHGYTIAAHHRDADVRRP